MLASVEKLLESDKDKKVGNHSVKFNDSTIEFYYFDTAICIQNENERTITIDNGGFFTPSTTRAINCYIKHFKSLGYVIIDKRSK